MEFTSIVSPSSLSDREAVVTWLQQAGLQRYIELFLFHEFESLETVSQINATDLAEMGITKVGAKRKILTVW